MVALAIIQLAKGAVATFVGVLVKITFRSGIFSSTIPLQCSSDLNNLCYMLPVDWIYVEHFDCYDPFYRLRKLRLNLNCIWFQFS